MRAFLLATGLLFTAPALGAQSAASRTLTLREAIALGRERGVTAALARLSQRVAEARAGERRSDLLPSVTAGASAGRQTLNLDEFGIPFASGTTDPFSLWIFQARASQTVFDWSAITRLNAARDSLAASGADARAVGDLSGAAAGLAYLRVLSARETVRAREADSAVAASLLDQARGQVEAGTSPTIDATRGEVQLASVRTQLEVARNQLDRSRLDLARTLDLPPESPLELVDSLETAAAPVPSDPDQAVSFALAHRPEVVAEQGRTRVAEEALSAIGREYAPSVGLSGYYKQSGQQLDNLSGTWAVQLQVTLPLLDGLGRPNREREQATRLEAQRLRQHDVELQVATEAREALLDLASADQQVVLAADRLQLAEQELEQADERFRAGVAGSVETTNAQGGLVSARDGLIQARVNAAVARVSAYRSLGVLDQM
jgi:outer membrane protein TolC